MTTGRPLQPSEIAIAGGGISGLASAHALAKAGHRVTLFEASDQLGGLGTFFEYRGHFLEKFYHCMLPTDRHLLNLLSDLQLTQDVYWKRTSFGFMTEGKLYGLNSALELLQFEPLSLPDRLRVGATGLRARLISDKGLDDVSCVEWLTQLSGRRSFEQFWKPMLQAKFGDRYSDIPALWFWRRLNREKGSGPERKGYIRGGYRRIIDALADSIRKNRGEMRLSQPVTSLDLDAYGRPLVGVAGADPRAFDQLLVASPVIGLNKAATGGKLDRVLARADAGVDYQGVVNAVFFLRRGFSKHYWVATMDEDIPFQGIVESTNLLEPEEAAGHTLVYVMNYVHRSEPFFALAETEILSRYEAGLRRLFPDLRQEHIVDRFLFRSPFVEPLYSLGYLQRRPPTVLLDRKVFLATTTQVYPDVTSWNGSIGVANAAVTSMTQQGSVLSLQSNKP